MSTLAVNSITDANGGNTATINSMTPTADSLQGFRNRILNGGMVIDQRNAGASGSIGSTTSSFTVDRNFAYTSYGGGTYQQVTDAPPGFSNSLKVTVNSTASPTGTNNSAVGQSIEGFNTADFGWGTANAKTVTLSFWVKSSITGTYSVAIRNLDNDRSWIATYSISTADTWEYKSIVVFGPTSGTWLTNSSIGVRLFFALGVGPDRQTSSTNSWLTGTFNGSTGTTNLFGTNGATWYITGVQLEVGSVATPFERRPYGAELALCQRYYFRMIDGGSEAIATGGYYSSTDCRMVVNFPVAMRIAPSVVASSGTDYFRIQRNSGDDTFNTLLDGGPKSPTTIMLFQNTNVSGTAGHAGFVYSNDPDASLAFNAEL